MRVSDEMVDRAARAIFSEHGTSGVWEELRTEQRKTLCAYASAALESVLDGCETKTWESGSFGLAAALYAGSNDPSLVGKRVALVPLDD